MEEIARETGALAVLQLALNYHSLLRCFEGKLTAAVHSVPVAVEEYVARHKLASMGISIDELTAKQKQYMSGWEQGT